MLKNYEATYENGQIKWLSDKPQISSACLIITVLVEKKLCFQMNTSGLEPPTPTMSR